MNIIKLILVLFILLLWQFIVAQTPSWVWAKRGGGSDIEYSKSIAVDAAGNSYITGYYKGNAVFGTTTLTGSTSNHDVFVAKADPSGNWLWAKKASGSADDYASGIAIDPAGTYAYVTGSFNSATMTFGSISITRTGTANTDIYVAKLNASTGAWIWATKAGGTQPDNGYGISLDANSNVFVTGDFNGTATFGSLPSLTSSGSNDIFAAKLDNNGIWQWATKAGGAGGEQGNAIGVSPESGIVITGGYKSTTASFGSLQLTNSGDSDVFVARLSEAGAWEWVSKAGGAGLDNAYALSTDPSGNIYLTGVKGNNAMFGAIYLGGTDSYDMFVAKIDAEGTWLWANKSTCPSYDFGYGIFADAWGEVVLTGNFFGTAVFGSTTLTGNAASNSDAFIAKISSGGTWTSAEKLGSSGMDSGYGVYVDASANVYWYGQFSGTVTLESFNLTSNNGSQDVFIAKKTNMPISVLSPNGSEELIIDTTVEIGWTSANITEVLVDYSINNGNAWTQLTPQPIPATPASLIWTIPDSPSTQALIRVRSAANASLWDASDSAFTIMQPPSPPESDFSATPLSGLEPLEVQFTDNSMAVSGSIVSWFWDFGDGESSSLQDPLHTYLDDGVYTVSLTVANSYDLSDTEIKSSYITVEPSYPEILLLSEDVIDFGLCDLGAQSAPHNVVLANTGTAPLNITNVYFPSGPLHFQFSEPRNFTIPPDSTAVIQVWFAPLSAGQLSDFLLIENDSYNTQAIVITLLGTGMEYMSLPEADFSADPLFGLVPLAVQFTDLSVPGAGSINLWQWDFGDGTYSTEQNPLHTYQSPGLYDVSLTVHNTINQSDDMSREGYITVIPTEILLELLSPSPIDFGEIIAGTHSEYQDVIIRNAGTAALTISDVWLGASLCFSFIEPYRLFTLEPGQQETILVRFTPQSAGVFTDSLFIENDSSNLPLLAIPLYGTGYVVYDPPVADFVASEVSGLVPLIVEFVDQSQPGSGEIITWEWDFGDGAVSTDQHPTHEYTQAGLYTVILSVTNSNSLSDTVTRAGYISVLTPVGQIALLSSPSLDFGEVFLGQTTPEIPVRIKNNGNRDIALGELSLQGENQVFQFRLGDDSLILTPGETDSIFVCCQPDVAGELIATLFIPNDSDNLPLLSVALSVTADYAPPLPPEDLTAYKAGNDIRLSWDGVICDVLGNHISVEYYLVYNNGSLNPYGDFFFHGLTADPDYIHAGAALFSPRMFYKIVAWDSIPGILPGSEADLYLQDNLLPGMCEAEVLQILSEAESIACRMKKGLSY